MKNTVLLFMVLFSLLKCEAKENKKVILHNSMDSIYVSKSQKKMYLYNNGILYKMYDVSVGANLSGHKQYEGDNRTPEGLYYIVDKNPNSRYYKNLGISYPNAVDIARAKKKKYSPGGAIKIHGYADNKGNSNYKNVMFAETWGCIAVTNQDMSEIYDLVKLKAKIFIAP